MKSRQMAMVVALLALTGSCSRGNDLADAYGNVEADVTIISAQTLGELVTFDVDEGMTLQAGAVVGLVDTVGLNLKKLEVLANRKAIASEAENLLAEIEVLNEQLTNLKREQARAVNLVQVGAATQQKLDDISNEIIMRCLAWF